MANSKFHNAARAIAHRLIDTGREWPELKKDFDTVYGAQTYAVLVHWNQAGEMLPSTGATWSATEEVDFITGYANEINIYIARAPEPI